jgi:hypothetical protein
MMMAYGMGLWTAVLPLLTPWWQQGLASVKTWFRKVGALR